MWGGRLGTGTRGQAGLQAALAVDVVVRDRAYQRELKKERREARDAYDTDEYKRLYSVEAMDTRCTLRHDSYVSWQSNSPCPWHRSVPFRVFSVRGP